MKVFYIIHRTLYFKEYVMNVKILKFSFDKGYHLCDLKVLDSSMGKYFEKHFDLMMKYKEKWI